MRDAAQLFSNIPSSIISDCMRRMSATHTLMPRHRGGFMVGSAYTVKVRPGDNLYIHQALRKAEPGQVLVVDGGGDETRALMGEIMMSVARMRGLVGLVINGAIRDSDAFKTHNFPCYARSVTPLGPFKNGPGDLSVPVTIDGCVVNPGDIVVGDADGVVFIPLDQVKAVHAACIKKMQHEADTLDAIKRNSYDDSWIDAALENQLV